MLEEYIQSRDNITLLEETKEEAKYYKAEWEKAIQAKKELAKKKDATIWGLQASLSECRRVLEEKKSFLKNFEQIKAELEEALQKKGEVLNEETLKMRQWEDRYAMLSEDIVRFFQFKDQVEIMHSQVAYYRERCSQYELNIQLGTVSSINDPGYISINPDDPVFHKVQSRYQSQHNFSLKSTKLKQKLDQPLLDLEEINIETVDLDTFKFYRPAFADLVTIQDQAEYLKLPFNNWVEVTIRGILDSKYNEILSSVHETPSRFPEFVYSWLECYYIDEMRNVSSLPLWKRDYANEARNEFLNALSSIQSKKVWELQTFRDFLCENFPLDELAFYLHCRFLLFNGPQLETAAGKFSAIHYLPLSTTMDTISFLMEKLLETDKAELRDMIYSKIRKSGSSTNVDAGYVLRILLEYYKMEKKARYLNVCELFKLNDPVKGPMDFVGFKHICESLDPHITSLQTATFYRDLWTITNGHITSDSFFLLANENGFFVKTLRLKKPPENPEFTSSVYRAFTSLEDELVAAKNMLKSIGVPALLLATERFEEYIRNRGEPSNEELFGWSLLTAHKQYWHLITKAALAFEQHNLKTAIEDTRQAINEEVSTAPASCRSLFIKMKFLQQKFRTQLTAIKRIQRSWRNKVRTQPK